MYKSSNQSLLVVFATKDSFYHADSRVLAKLPPDKLQWM